MGFLVAAIPIPSQRTCFQSTPLFRLISSLHEVNTFALNFVLRLFIVIRGAVAQGA